MRFLVAAVLTVLWTLPAHSQDRGTASEQPETGPGGRDYVHSKVVQNTFLSRHDQYWLFEPTAPRPTKPSPVIVLLHGWGGMSPYSYGAWIEHLVRRGNVVIYPRYQAHMLTPPWTMTPAAIRSIRDAFERLDGTEHVLADSSRMVLAGHSLGGTLAANIAALASQNGLPRPAAVLAIQPADSHAHSDWRTIVPSLLVDHSLIPKDTLLVLMVGTQDRVAGDTIGKKIFENATGVATQNKNLLVLSSDRRGQPHLVASHRQPFAPDRRYNYTGKRQIPALSTGKPPTSSHLDAHDFYGTWKLLDALIDTTYRGTNRQYALGDTPEQRFLGRWSDGTPIREFKVIIGQNSPSQKRP